MMHKADHSQATSTRQATSTPVASSTRTTPPNLVAPVKRAASIFSHRSTSSSASASPQSTTKPLKSSGSPLAKLGRLAERCASALSPLLPRSKQLDLDEDLQRESSTSIDATPPISETSDDDHSPTTASVTLRATSQGFIDKLETSLSDEQPASNEPAKEVAAASTPSVAYATHDPQIDLNNFELVGTYSYADRTIRYYQMRPDQLAKASRGSGFKCNADVPWYSTYLRSFRIHGIEFDCHMATVQMRKLLSNYGIQPTRDPRTGSSVWGRTNQHGECKPLLALDSTLQELKDTIPPDEIKLLGDPKSEYNAHALKLTRI